MKSLVKMTLIGGVIALALSGCNDKKTGDNLSTLSQTEQESYAMGSSFSIYLQRSLSAQQIKLDPEYVIKGFTDTYQGKSQMSNEQVEEIVVGMSKRFQQEAKERLAKEASDSLAVGKKFQTAFMKQKGAQKTASGLMYKIINPGTGNPPTLESTVEVNYTGKLVDGREFDSSYSRNEPATFPLMYVIKGWSEGLQLIGQGGEIELVVPPELAYGDQSLPAHEEGQAPIPSQSTLVFNIKLLKIEKTSNDILKRLSNPAMAN